MCTVRADVYECDAPECAARGTDRLGLVRRNVASLLTRESGESAVDAMLVANLMVACAFESGTRPVRVRAERRVQERSLWIDVSGCSPTVADSPTIIDRIVLDELCGSWGIITTGAEPTLWADIPLTTPIGEPGPPNAETQLPRQRPCAGDGA